MKKITPGQASGLRPSLKQGLRHSAHLPAQLSPWLPWTIVALIAISCGALAVLQYRWITEFAAAERDRMRADLQSRLELLSRDFNREVSDAVRELVPEPAQIEKLGREKAYAARFHQQPMFKRIALAIPRDNFEKSDVILENLDFAKQQFVRSAWPEEWKSMRGRLMSRMDPSRAGPPRDVPVDSRAPTLMEIPRFGESDDRPGFREEEWLIVELDETYLRETTLPGLVKKYLEEPNGLNYDTDLKLSSEQPLSSADASVPLLAVQFRMSPPQRGPGPRFGRRGPPPDGFRPPPGRGRGFGPPPGDRGFGEFRPPPNRRGPPAGPPPDFSRAGFEAPRWRLYVRHRAGSLEALTVRARNRNIMISGGLLLLILSIVGLLLRLSRQSQKLAESQMNFVAGVSHELRTPLTVIRTAAYNLRGKMANHPEQVEKYGKLIQDESERLGALVEQVLQFASGEAGHQIRERAPVAIESLIEESLKGGIGLNGESLESRGIEIDKRIDGGLPPALVDRLAMSHALRNLIDNAVKYGTEKNRWIGVTAAGVTTSQGPAIEVRIADRGPGIPADEQAHIFDPFFRGSRAIADQVHGTGLGLDLARRIIEAHGGTIEVNSSESGTEFVVRIPAASQGVRAEKIA